MPVVDLARVSAALPNYLLGSELGAGAYGLVLAGQHRDLGRDVAVKVVTRASSDEWEPTDFKAEARLLAGLDHPHIVRIYDYVERDNLYLIIMELLSGGSLGRRRALLSPEGACAVGLAAAEALGYAHSRGVLHRDVKPANILFTASGLLKVTDFGVAKIFDAASATASKVIGTPRYMAPEQVETTRLGPGTDIYALGVVLYELFTGGPPFDPTLSMMALFQQKVYVDPQPPAGVPEPVSKVIMRALARDQAERHSTARAFALDLAEAAARAYGPLWLDRCGLVLHLAQEVRDAGSYPARRGGGPAVGAAYLDLSGPRLPPSTAPPADVYVLSDPPAPGEGFILPPSLFPTPSAPPSDPPSSVPPPAAPEAARSDPSLPAAAASPSVPVPARAPAPPTPPPTPPPARRTPAMPASWPGSAPALPTPSTTPPASTPPASTPPAQRPGGPAGRAAPPLAVPSRSPAPAAPPAESRAAPSRPTRPPSGGPFPAQPPPAQPRPHASLPPPASPPPVHRPAAPGADDPSSVRPAVTDERAPDTEATFVARPAPAEPRREGKRKDKGRRRRLVVALAGVLVLALAASLAVLLTRGGGRGPVVITTVAGNGSQVFSGDNGPAVAAGLKEPDDPVLDSFGRLYFVDGGHNRIRVVEPDGTIRTVAGNGEHGFSGDGGPATAARLASPTGIMLDVDGSLLIADKDNQRVRRVGRDGVISTIAGTGVRGYAGDGGPAIRAQLADPTSIALDGDGRILLVDVFNHCIRRIDHDGTIRTVAGNGKPGFSGDGGPATAAQLSRPGGVVADSAGRLYIADNDNNRVRRVDGSGIITTIAGTGKVGFAGDGGPAVRAEFSEPAGVELDDEGRLYVADLKNHRVRRIDPDGTITTIAGNGGAGATGDGGPPTSATMLKPNGLEVTPSGDLYVSDAQANRIRLIAPEK